MAIETRALLIGGVVDNVILIDTEVGYEPPAGATIHNAPPEVGPGWGLVGGTWVAPVVEALVEPVEPFIALRESGIAKLMALGLTEAEAGAIAGL